VCLAAGLTALAVVFVCGVVAGGLWAVTRQLNRALEDLWSVDFGS
jgi:hypothetical protein